MEQNKDSSKKHRNKMNKVRIVVKPIYVGDNSMAEVFEKVAYDNIKNRMKASDIVGS